MSLMSRIGARLVRKPTAVPSATSKSSSKPAQASRAVVPTSVHRERVVEVPVVRPEVVRAIADVQVPGRAEPPPVVVRAPLDPAIIAGAAAAADKAAAAQAVEARREELEATGRWKSPCKAIDAETGLQCGLLKGHTVDHRHARGAFRLVANTAPGARAVDAWAWRTTG